MCDLGKLDLDEMRAGQGEIRTPDLTKCPIADTPWEMPSAALLATLLAT